jgi:adenine deaminase
MNLNEIIKAARGEKPVDLLLTNARIVNVFAGEVVTDAVAISDGMIVGFGPYEAKKVLDLNSRYVAPGFIDGHVHIESSMACIAEFARAVLVHGTTTVAADPHEIANVLGSAGIEYMLQSAEQQPMNLYFTLPSCVPATDMETAGARLSAEDLQPFLSEERIVALAEMMNYPGVILRDPAVLAKISVARQQKKPVDGHAPGLKGRELYAYISDGINAKTSRRMMWCTDDRHPHDLIVDGHIDSIVREAIQAGLDPLLAIQMATLNPAAYFGLSHLGAVAPGKQADLVVFRDIKKPVIEKVYHRGILTAENEKIRPEIEFPAAFALPPAMHVDLQKVDFSIPAVKKRIRVIEIVSDQLITHERIEEIPFKNNQAVSDPSRDLLKIAVVERHKGTGNIGKGFVKGFGLKRGALASSVAHDSHNIIIVGTSDEDMQAALEAVVKMGGGLAAVSDARLLAGLALPVAGLMSLEPVRRVRDQLEHLIGMAHNMGAALNDPFMTLSFLALPVIPELKLTDKGLIDVNKFEVVPLFV